jgi:hypothetical protein
MKIKTEIDRQIVRDKNQKLTYFRLLLLFLYFIGMVFLAALATDLILLVFSLLI